MNRTEMEPIGPVRRDSCRHGATAVAFKLATARVIRCCSAFLGSLPEEIANLQ